MIRTQYKGSRNEVRALGAFVKLVRAAESVSARIHRHLADTGLSVSQFGVLEAIYHRGPLSQAEIAKKVLNVGILGPLWLVCLLVPGIGSILFAVLGGAVSAFFLGYDYHDYAFSRRRLPFRRKWALLTHNFAFTLGFGTNVSLMLLVPVVGLLFPPFAAVGGTIACLDYERYGRLAPLPRS